MAKKVFHSTLNWPIQSQHHTCAWVLEPATFENPAVYCGKPTSYTMEKDDDSNLRRQYKPFCDSHQKKADIQDANEEG